MIARVGGLIVWLAMLLAPVGVPAAETRPRSILLLDQSDLRGPFYYQAFSALRAEVSANPQSHVTLYLQAPVPARGVLEAP